MSLMDDIFDLREHVKGTEMEPVLERIEDRLWRYEVVNDIAVRLWNRRDDVGKALAELDAVMDEASGKKVEDTTAA